MSIEYFLHQYQDKFKNFEKRSWGLLCNQTSWSFTQKKYLFEILDQVEVLKRVFLPEHGLFAELQDQVALDDGSIYNQFSNKIDFVSLYGSEESTLVANAPLLSDLQVLVVDIQDVGSRYYTFATTLSYLFETISKHNLDLEVVIIERPNPAGRQVEGSTLPTKFESFVGFPGIVHRHGLSIGELAHYYRDQHNVRSKIKVIYDPQKVDNLFAQSPISMHPSFHITPSPNMPTSFTPFVYSGQCLLEGTSLSEGRGTTRPFEIFGSPNLHSKILHQIPQAKGAVLRPLRFIPTFHKHTNDVCEGWQIHVHEEEKYNSLLHSLRMILSIKEADSRFSWRSDEYEFRSDKPAIELLVGDPTLLNFLNGKESLVHIEDYLRHSQEQWILSCNQWKIHEQPLFYV